MAGKGRAQGGMSGGRRPGAGAKRKETVEMQGNRRDALLDVVSEKLWRETVKEWFAFARETNSYHVLFPLLPYIMGSAKQEINVTFDVPEVAAELGAQYGVPADRVTSIVERLQAKKAG
jgi:hypothetical protein